MEKLREERLEKINFYLSHFAKITEDDLWKSYQEVVTQTIAEHKKEDLK
jgi:hypothetical protein